MLQRDFISLLPKKVPWPNSIWKQYAKVLTPESVHVYPQGLDHVAENVLSFLDARSLCAAELVSKEWLRVISEVRRNFIVRLLPTVIFQGMLWKKLIERKVNTDSLWKGLADRSVPRATSCKHRSSNRWTSSPFWILKSELRAFYFHRRGWVQYLFKPRPGESHPSHSFYRRLYPSIIKDIDVRTNSMMNDASSLFALYAIAGAISTAGDRGQLASYFLSSHYDYLQFW